jgi:type IV fimbrial biogenesis protein FimT
MKHLSINRRAHQLGVTLVETAVAMSVVSAAAGLAVPGFGNAIERRHIEGAAQQFETDVHYARSLAVASNNPVRISFSADASGSCYVIHSGGANLCQCTADGSAACTGDALALRTVRLEAETGVRLESNSRSILFDPTWGTSTPTGTVQVVGRSGAAIHQIVNIMGRVRSCSPAPAIADLRTC